MNFLHFWNLKLWLLLFIQWNELKLETPHKNWIIDGDIQRNFAKIATLLYVRCNIQGLSSILWLMHVWSLLQINVWFWFTICRMKRKFYSWEECMNLREVKVRMAKLRAGYGTFFCSSTSSNWQQRETWDENQVSFPWEDNAVWFKQQCAPYNYVSSKLKRTTLSVFLLSGTAWFIITNI